MSLPLLIIREILHRKLRFVLGVVAVLTAVACVTAALTVLKLHDLRTEEIVGASENELKERMDQLEDESRRITKDMGFNLQIVPRGQVLDPFAPDYASLDMPCDYARRLAGAKLVTVNHVLPRLEQRL